MRIETDNLFRITFYHISGRHFTIEAYCVGLDQVKSEVAERELSGWRASEVCVYESVLNDFLYECYRMRVDA